MDIVNEVKTTDKDFEKKKFVVRNAADIQRAKLEKLMKNPEKPIIIPEGPRDRDFSSSIPSFVRNVMGSSAGAGSGEFHVYRHLRRKEYARQKQIQDKSRSELLDDEFQAKLEKNKQDADERTAKKRAKRQKKKAKQKANRGKKLRKTDDEPDEESTSEEEEEEGDKPTSGKDEAKIGEGDKAAPPDGEESGVAEADASGKDHPSETDAPSKDVSFESECKNDEYKETDTD
ncbi:PRKR-interacting protein 1 homolog [Uranotaenia lowii]|uniref:PRKR-interacting protein 1 homolog n=1 Tax=Uranotaenia lowii TaxID=190385 RepID=UPI00247907A3|nr:PRKR-interacting protein 1 homolog [Uranotaenia lowii]